jgi:glycosyltransferase involved in cell wall biosynthesis
VKLLFVIDEMEAITAGGSERQLLELIEFARAVGHEVQLGIFRGTQWLTPEQTECRIHRLELGSLLLPGTLAKLLRFGAFMRRERFDAVITMFWEANLIIPPLARGWGIPVVIGSRRNLNYWMSDRVALLQRISNVFATRLLANCNAVKEVVAARERTGSEKIDVLYNGIDVDRFRPDSALRDTTRASLGIRADEVVVGNSSTFRPIKGVDIFVAAARSLAQMDVSCRFLLVGDGPERARIEQLIATSRLEDRFVLVGSQKNVAPFLFAMDIAVLSSRSEGFSNSLLEYMAAGLPSVASDVGGNREALGEAGLVVPADDPDSLAQAIAHLAKDVSVRARLAQRARTRAVEVFSRSVAAERFAAYLAQIPAPGSR